MAKKNKKRQFKKPSHSYRNAAPRPRAGKPEDETALKRLLYTAGGAAGTAFAGALLKHEGWAPKTIATALGAVGAGLAWKGDAETVRSVGAGVMSAAGGQLAMLMIDDHDQKTNAPPATQVAKKPSNVESLPPGALESALERAQARLALSASGM